MQTPNHIYRQAGIGINTTKGTCRIKKEIKSTYLQLTTISKMESNQSFEQKDVILKIRKQNSWRSSKP